MSYFQNAQMRTTALKLMGALLISSPLTSPAIAQAILKAAPISTTLVHSVSGAKHTAHKAGSAKIGEITIEQAWTRQAPPGAKVVGGYARITNSGKASDSLVGGSASFAERIEVHEMKVVDEVMRMAPLSNGLEVKPGETVELKPGSFHLMFMGATSPKAGDIVPVTLRFKNAGEVKVMFPVGPIGVKSAPAHKDGHGDHGKHGKKKHGS